MGLRAVRLGIADVLRATDLDELAAIVASYRPARGDAAVVRGVLDRWEDRQAIGNLLLHPALVPADLRAPVLLRALGDAVPYLRLAAAAGAGGLDAGDLAGADRDALVVALLATVDAPEDLIATRAAASLGAVAVPADAGGIVALLAHRLPAVRRHVEALLLVMLGTDGLAAVLADGTVPDDVVATAHATLAGDGIDLAVPAAEQPILAALPSLPNLADWS